MVSNAKIDREAKTLMKKTGVPLWLARKYVLENNNSVDSDHPLSVVAQKDATRAALNETTNAIAQDAYREV